MFSLFLVAVYLLSFGYIKITIYPKKKKLVFVNAFLNFLSKLTLLLDCAGYKMDEHDPDSNYLRLQFSRYPGPRSGTGARGRR